MMSSFKKTVMRALGALALGMMYQTSVFAAVDGWLNWRGPQQNGTSMETGLPDKLSLEKPDLLWEMTLSGRGTPVVAGDRVYVFGYEGEGPELQEVLRCVEAETGKILWEKRFNDFMSDIIYNRYSIGSPTVDPETGNVYLLTSPGLLLGFTPAGEKIWEHSMMESFGRLTFPNGRTGAPAIEGDLVIVQAITANWGAEGPARNRFYAFDKSSGDIIWSSTPGETPKDSSFAMPVFTNLGNRRVFFTGTGCGNLVCVDARTGKPLSRYKFLVGGVNSSVLLYKDNSIIAVHDLENIDSSDIGRMIRLKMDAVPGKDGEQVVLDKSAEVWRNGLSAFSSSGVLVGDRIYQVGTTGSLYAIHAETGAVLWEKKISYTQLHASPLYADSKLYLPMKDGNFHILRPTDSGAEEVSKVKLDGECLGAPAIWNGKIYVHTTAKLYCFGKAGDNPGRPQSLKMQGGPKVGSPVSLQVVPSEVLVTSGNTQQLKLRAIDDVGRVVTSKAITEAQWEGYIPPTARVKASLNAEVSNSGVLKAAADNQASAGMFKATADGLTGFVRGRIMASLPFNEDFSSFSIDEKSANGDAFAYPPLPWIGARFKWQIEELEGNKVLAKDLGRLLFQRTVTFFGHPDMKDYTVMADVMTDGNRRIMSTVGVVNQRYIISLDGNWQVLEVNSNHDRLKVSVPFEWGAKVWYRLKTRVDVAPDGSGVIRAKAWKRDEAEPSAWTIEVPHKTAHTHGSPGLYGFTPQNKKRVFIDNISVTPNNERN